MKTLTHKSLETLRSKFAVSSSDSNPVKTFSLDGIERIAALGGWGNNLSFETPPTGMCNHI
jgi:hypothetical protein